jgi:hypothetical protein
MAITFLASIWPEINDIVVRVKIATSVGYLFAGGNDRNANDMATKKTATKKTSRPAKKKVEDPSIESLLAKLRAAAPPESDRDLGRWVLGKMLADMVSKVLDI